LSWEIYNKTIIKVKLVVYGCKGYILSHQDSIVKFYLAKLAKVYDVTGKPLKLRTRQKYPYSRIIDLLVKGREVFIEGVNKFQAQYIRKQLVKRISKKLEQEGIVARVNIEMEPAEWDLGNKVVSGYVFRLESVDVLSRGDVYGSERVEAKVEKGDREG